MADSGPILVTGAAGQLGAVGRTVTGLLLDRGLPVRALVRRVPGGERDHGGGRPGNRGERPAQHVPDDSLPDEHPEHHTEPSAAAAARKRGPPYEGVHGLQAIERSGTIESKASHPAF